MIAITGRIYCANQVEAELLASLLEDHTRLTRAEKGCLSFHMLPTSDPLVWLIDEAFADLEAYEAHQARTRQTPWHGATAHLRREVKTTGL